MQVIESTLRVRYAETDAMGVVYHTNFLIWFEIGRGDYFRALGQDYGAWEQEGLFLPVSEAYARYHAATRYGELVTVRTWLQQVRSRSLTFGYAARRTADQKRLATGWTKHICADREGRARRLPGDMIRLLERP